MSVVGQLPRYEAPPCAKCRAMAPEVVCPVGEGAADLCWLCAHLVAVHGDELRARVRDCGCPASEVFPSHAHPRVTAARVREPEPAPAPVVRQISAARSMAISRGMRAASKVRRAIARARLED